MRTRCRAAAIAMSLLLLVACSDDDGGDGTATAADQGSETTEPDEGNDAEGSGDEGRGVDAVAAGLWDDGPCDASLEPLVIGTSTVFESEIISLGDQAVALEAAAEAFNQRGGANGACIEVHTCDDGADADQALACVRELDAAGVVATVNDLTTAGNAEVASALADAGIPRVATNVSPADWADPNAFPVDASSTGTIFLSPQGLLESDVTDIAVIRPDLAQSAALIGLLGDMYADDGATFTGDIVVPAGTTDFTQFVLAAQDQGAGGVVMALGEQEAVQVIRAAQQLGSDVVVGATLSTFPHAKLAELGDFASQMVFVAPFPPATFDLPVYEVVRADLAASGHDALQPAELKAGSVRSWIGLYGLLQVVREAGLDELTREGITAALQSSGPVPMLGIFGDQDWEPNAEREGLFKRAGTDRWGVYRWDHDAEAPDGLEGGNFVEASTVRFDEVLCGSPFGSPCGGD